MKKVLNSCILFLALLTGSELIAQSNVSTPYCQGSAATGNCNQPNASNNPNNFINDFINDFNTCGANNDIVNNNSGCCNLPNNYINYVGTTHTLIVAPNQYITCNIRSGITFNQGFAVFIDWNQNNTFDMPSEQVAATGNVPPAFTWTAIGFTVPPNQPLGNYRMRVRCQFSVPGTATLPCGVQTFGETEDYLVTVVANNSSSVLSGTATSNSPLCGGQTLNLNIAMSPTTSAIKWSGPNSFTSSAVSPTIQNATPAMNGVYSVTLGTGGCPFITTVAVVVAPSSTFIVNTPSYTICQGGMFAPGVFLASLGSSANSYTYNWSTSSPALIWTPSLPLTNITPSLLPTGTTLATQYYSITVSPTLQLCPTVKVVTVTIHNPRTPTLTMPSPLCDIFSPVQLTATPGGGTWSANAGAVTPNGMYNPAAASIGTNAVTYTISSGSCFASNSATLSVSRFNTAALTSGLGVKCVQDAPFNMLNIVQTTVTGVWSGIQTANNTFTPTGLPTGSYTFTYNTMSTPIGSVCPSSTVLVVSVFNPPVPFINYITPKCTNSPSVILTANPSGGVWTGTGISPAGVQTPSLNLTIPSNTVMYTAGLGTCVASSTRTFEVAKYNPAVLTSTFMQICASSNPINLMGITQNTNGSWFGVNVTNDMFNPLGLSTNNYNLFYRTFATYSNNVPAPNNLLCPDSSKVVVSVLNPPTPNIAPAGPFCNTMGSVQLTVSPATGTWVATPYLTPSGLFTPSLSTVGNQSIQYIIGTTTCNASQSKIVAVEAFVPATIAGVIKDQCNTSPPVNLMAIAPNTSGSWSGPGVVGGNFNPANAGAGTFSLAYQTSSFPSGLCPDKDIVVVRVYSLAIPSIAKIGPVCSMDLPKQLQVDPIGGLFGSSTSGVVSSSGLFNPALGVIGDNLINYSISVGPCIANAQVNVTIEKFVSANFLKHVATAYCSNALPFNLNSLVENPGGNWSGPGVTGSMFDPSKANIGEGNLITYETHSSTTPSLCPDMKQIRIRVKNIPEVTAVSNVASGCAPLEVVLNTPNVNEGRGAWNLGDGAEKTGFTTTHIYTQPGTYTVLFSYTDPEAEGCFAQALVPTPITVFESPKADFLISPEEISISNPDVTLTNISTNLSNNKYTWTIQGMDQVYEINPRISFPHIGSYRITLSATTLNQCKDEITKTVEVKNDFNVYIPNSFTPNYDGINDVFLPVFSPYGLDTKTFVMEIYDRWGHEVFRTKDVTKGWNGTVQNKGDQPLKQDSYIYKIKYKDLDGNVYDKMGYLSLLAN